MANEIDDDKAQEKEQQKESGKKAAKVAAKAAGNYFAGPIGGKAVDAIANTKAGQKILDKAGNVISKSPIGKQINNLDKIGGLDAADKAVNTMGSQGITPGGSSQTSNIGSQFSKPQGEANSDANNIAGLPPGTKGKKGKSILDDDNDTNNEDIELSGTATLGKTAKITILLGVLTSPFLIVVLTVLFASNVLGIYKDGLGINTVTGGRTGDIDYKEENPEAAEFYERVNNIKNEMQQEGKDVDAFKIVATYYILSKYDGNLSYKKMTNRKIKEIAEAMINEEGLYDETIFKNNLVDDIIKSHTSNMTKTRREAIADEIFEYIKNYYEFIGDDTNTCTSSSGTCDYSINGFYSQSTGNMKKGMNVSNLKVRLMQCGGRYGSGTWGQPLLGEELIDFEKYVLGVTYGEIGTSFEDEAIKAQIVAVRSFSLSRPSMMNNSLGKKLSKENNQWILQMSSCVADQVYCDPDQGCSKMNDGIQGGTIRSGHSIGTYRSPALAENSKLRVLAKEVEGEVLVNNQGNIISTSYINTTQNLFNKLAKQGLNYKQILLQVYNQGTTNSNAKDVSKMNCGMNVGVCGTTSTGEYSTWKQYDQRWKNVSLGNSTVGRIGCLATSVSILLAKSGVETNLGNNLNPGTFVQYLSSKGGFYNGNFMWNSVTKLAPNFKFVDKIVANNYSNQQKIDTIKDLISKGYYVTVQVSTSPQHWVAVDNIVGNQVNILDPASKETTYGKKYPISATGRIAYFKITT